MSFCNRIRSYLYVKYSIFAILFQCNFRIFGRHKEVAIRKQWRRPIHWFYNRIKRLKKNTPGPNWTGDTRFILFHPETPLRGRINFFYFPFRVSPIDRIRIPMKTPIADIPGTINFPIGFSIRHIRGSADLPVRNSFTSWIAIFHYRMFLSTSRHAVLLVKVLQHGLLLSLRS